MSDHAAHSHAAAPFTPAEVDALHRDDVASATAFISLMTAVFAIGLVLYIVVAWICAS